VAATSRRAVFTGIGVLNALGLDAPTYWDALLQGRSGVGPLRSFDASALPVRIASEITNFDPNRYIEKKQRRSLRMMARVIQLAVAAAEVALRDSKIEKEKIDRTRFGVEFGASAIAMEPEELGDAALASANCQPRTIDLAKWGSDAIGVIQPLWMLKYLPNMLACHVSILHDAQGPTNSITQSDVASLLALGESFRILQRDSADLFLVGGADSKTNPFAMMRHCLFDPLSKRNDAPEQASRPFDRQRDGMVIGEGGAVLVLEELEHARRRGARIYGELAGFGAACDTRRTGDGLARAVRAALEEAGIGIEDVDHINAHGLGTVESDVWEARGLHQVFGAATTPIPVLAAKSYLGNLGAGGGLTELAASILALHHNLMPATLNCDDPDPACPVAVHTGTPRPVSRPYVVKVSSTQQGQCAAVVIRRWDHS
jgi:3-oxoacyl-[acyl-carrier-protein] synthase II